MIFALNKNSKSSFYVINDDEEEIYMVFKQVEKYKIEIAQDDWWTVINLMVIETTDNTDSSCSSNRDYRKSGACSSIFEIIAVPKKLSLDRVVEENEKFRVKCPHPQNV